MTGTAMTGATTTRPRTTIRGRTLSATAATAVLALAACGGSDDAAETADASTDNDGGGALVIDQSAAGAAEASTDQASTDQTSIDETGASDADGGAVDATATDEEEQALAFARCMRDEGIDWPDPVTNADGSIDLLGGQLPRDLGGLDADATQAAADACAPLIDGASFLPGDGGTLDAETQDALLDFAECLRDNGLDVDDPDLSSGAGPGAITGIFGEGFDPNDPDNAAAIDACRGLFAGGQPGGLAGG
ncbi:MAG: hypothetical protein AAFP84_10820 [Actinomycetota bacterium]